MLIKRFKLKFLICFINIANILSKVQDNNSQNTMPAPPKKYNTFVADGNSKKDTINVGFGDMPKPVTRTGSTVNAVSYFFSKF